MRKRHVLVLVGLMIGSTAGGPVSAAAGHESGPQGRVCASQLTQDIFVTWTSQNFEDALDQYDSVAADDLQVSRKCRARALTVVGYYNDSSQPSAESETVTFYRDLGGRPGRVISSQTVVGEEDGQGSYEITLDRAVRLHPGRTYWLSVQVNMDWQPGGFLWSWQLHAPVEGSQPMWMNPDDGFATGCVDWTPLATCSNGQAVGDLMFEVRTR